MDELPDAETPPSLPGGAGWGVRRPAPRRQDAQGELTEATSAPPGLAPATAAPPPFAPAAAASPAPPRRGLGLIGAAAAVAAVALVGVVVMAAHRSPTASTDAAAIATPVATAAPAPTSAAAMQAGHEYLAAVTPLNAAENRFGAAYTAAMHSSCSCPAGQFDASPAMAQLPAIGTAIESLQVTLQHIRFAVPGLAADIDAVVADNRQEVLDFAAARHAYLDNDAAGITASLNLAATDQQKAGPDIRRLRADLGLPPAG